MSAFFPDSVAVHAARKRVSITLRDFSARTALDLTHVGIAEFRHRMELELELERVLGGAAAVLEALLAYERAYIEEACHPPHGSVQDAHGCWTRAMDRALAAAQGGPVRLEAAWFEVKVADVPTSRPPGLRRRRLPAPARGSPQTVQISLF